MNELYNLSFVIPVILIIGVLSCLLNTYSFKDYIAIVGYYLMLCLSIDVLSRLAMIIGSVNLILFSVLSFFEITILAFLYKQKILKSRWLLVLIVIGLFYIFIEGFIIDQNVIESFQTYSRIVSSFLIVLMVLNYLFTELKQGSVLKNETIHFVLLFYYSLEFMLLIPFNFLINASETSIMYIWMARVLINITFYSSLIFFIWRNGKILK